MTGESHKSYTHPPFFLNYFFMIVPDFPSMAEAKVITTWDTPASIAENEFSSFGIIPPCITPSATYSLNKSGVMTGITLSSSSRRARLLSSRKQYINVTSNRLRQSFGCFSCNRIGICIKHMSFPIVSQRSHNRNDPLVNQRGKHFGAFTCFTSPTKP